MDEKADKKFTYTYSAKIQREIERIYEKYAPKKAPPEDSDESRLDALRRLDRQAERPGLAVFWIAAVLGILLFGAGMSAILTMSERRFAPGVALGIGGIALLCAAVPLRRRVTKNRREKLAPRVLRLAEELGVKIKENHFKGE